MPIPGTDVSGDVWSAPFVGAYLAGVVAFRARPERLASRRLLLFGSAATIAIAAMLVVVHLVGSGAPRPWIGSPTSPRRWPASRWAPRWLRWRRCTRTARTTGATSAPSCALARRWPGVPLLQLVTTPELHPDPAVAAYPDVRSAGLRAHGGARPRRSLESAASSTNVFSDFAIAGSHILAKGDPEHLPGVPRQVRQHPCAPHRPKHRANALIAVEAGFRVSHDPVPEMDAQETGTPAEAWKISESAERRGGEQRQPDGARCGHRASHRDQ